MLPKAWVALDESTPVIHKTIGCFLNLRPENFGNPQFRGVSEQISDLLSIPIIDLAGWQISSKKRSRSPLSSSRNPSATSPGFFL